MEFLRDYLADDMDRLDAALDRAFDVEGQLMSDVAAYVRAQRGKLLRPAVVCLTARTLGYEPSGGHHITLGAAIEAFHVATLLHDDVIDKAPMRRGKPTVNARWGDDVAILFADYLFATSFDMALSTLNPETLRVLTRTTQQMTEGEFLQVERRGCWLTEEEYIEIVTKKTAVLFSASASLGAVIAGATTERIARMARFGLDFGIAFQITDDTLDYEAQNANWGKRVGADLAEGKQTLPLLYTLESASDVDREALLGVLNDGRDFATVQSFVQKYNAVGYSLDVAGRYCREALETLDGLGGDSEAAGLLRQVADSVLVRQY